VDDQKRIFLAVIFSGFVLFGWQYFFSPPKTKNQPIETTIATKNTNENNSALSKSNNSSLKKTVENKQDFKEAVEVESWVISNENYEFKINNRLEVLSLVDSRENVSSVDIVGAEKQISFLFSKRAQTFSNVYSLKDKTDNSLVLISGEQEVYITLLKDRVNFSFSNLDANLKMVFESKPLEKDQFNFRQFIYVEKEVETIKVGDTDNFNGQFQIVGVEFDHYIFTAAFKEGRKFGVISSTETNELLANITNNEKQPMEFDLFLLKKEYDNLVKAGSNLKLTVDFGLFSVLAIPIFRLLQWFYNLVPNWGLAIIFLTLIIRLLTLPLQYKSSKSMKKVQKIQPELAKLKEKFKDDPQRMQKESMELFKRAGANPLSGCFPLLLQMPIFFAFYKVLYNTVELVGAPFILWIHDLSIKDPFYVLPVLMTIAMFLQQKLTPTTVSDPTQQKVMLFMPLIFGFIMKDLPSGLNLYIFVSTVFGIIQQLILFKKIND
jgi:YidC/Oxa1 family membrane protein insertase